MMNDPSTKAWRRPEAIGLSRCAAVFAVLWLVVLPGCAGEPVVNPSFNVTVREARAALKAMKREPVALDRPVVVIGGWSDVVGVAPAYIAEQLKKATGDERILFVAGGIGVTFDDCRGRVLDRLEAEFPSDDPGWTAEVDVIGFSMGGVTARYAAMASAGDDSSKRLRIARLYTIATPHRGAVMAEQGAVVDPLSRDMHPGSEFIRQLNEHRALESYRIIAYTCLSDNVVGPVNSAPPGVTPWWVPPEPFTRPHGGAYHDPRIIADIARRLRGEPAFTTEPVTALPEEGGDTSGSVEDE